mmetsp:Transcript_75616/g.180675  ORF Transcript_75616/g.180675 Transcript_75616/m.180675 type:complete len:261 (-) Transcript_75616:819-1601(-)
MLPVVATPLVELREGFLFDDLGVESCDSVDLVGADDGEVAHADLLDVTFLYDAQSRDDRPITPPLQQLLDPDAVDVINDLQVPRKHPLHHLNRPFLQSLRHDSVVGIVQALPGQFPCSVPIQLLHIHQKAHELCNSNGGMCVVHLHGNLLRQVFPLIIWSLDEFAQQILQRRAHEEVLLAKAKLPSSIRCIVRVEHGRQIFRFAPLCDRILKLCAAEGIQVELLARTSSPKSQVVCVVGVKARNGIIIRHCLYDLAPDPP